MTKPLTSPSFPNGLADNRTLEEARSQIAGSKASYRREDYMFPREQSRTMQVLSWEDEPQPEPYWLICLSAGGYLALGYAVYLLLPFLSALVRALG